MSIACIFGYAPQMFAFALYGNMLDRNPGMAGYRMVFMTMIGFAILGVVITTILLGMIKKKKRSGNSRLIKRYSGGKKC